MAKICCTLGVILPIAVVCLKRLATGQAVGTRFSSRPVGEVLV